MDRPVLTTSGRYHHRLGTKTQALGAISALSQELVRFDLQQLHNPEIRGVEYQQGTIWGYEVREYLLEKWGRTCVYCGTTDVPLEIEHLMPKSQGGSKPSSQ